MPDAIAPGVPLAAPGPSEIADATLVAHLTQLHHGYARSALPYVLSLLAKVSGFHRRRNAKLPALCEAGEDLAGALEAHMDDVEAHLFPALLAGDPRRAALHRELGRLQRRHGELALYLARVRWLADEFAVPSWGGRSYQALMEELEALEEHVLEHIHLERHALFPRLSSRRQPS